MKFGFNDFWYVGFVCIDAVVTALGWKLFETAALFSCENMWASVVQYINNNSQNITETYDRLSVLVSVLLSFAAIQLKFLIVWTIINTN